MSVMRALYAVAISTGRHLSEFTSRNPTSGTADGNGYSPTSASHQLRPPPLYSRKCTGPSCTAPEGFRLNRFGLSIVTVTRVSDGASISTRGIPIEQSADRQSADLPFTSTCLTPREGAVRRTGVPQWFTIV